MQRVSALLPSWNSSRNSAGSTSGKTSLDKVRSWTATSGNRLSTASSKSGRETYAPTTLDKECERAARILISFCRDGYLVTDDRPSSPTTTSSGTSTRKILKKIPPRIIQNAVGLAVFTSMRSGLWSSGSGGSGVLLARKTDGTWSPPSGLTLQTASLGFVLGVDICDCVVIINSFTTLETFGRSALTLGTDVQMTSGPVVSLGLLENEFKWADLSDVVFTYVKSKGLATDTKLDGTVLTERADENERFYGCSFSVPKILAGDVNQSLPQLRSLHEVLKFAEGRNDYDADLVEQLANQPTPGDASIEPSHSGAPSPVFGIPNPEDPDPYGVLALGLAGSEIREAGTRLRPDSSQFDFCPSPASPAFPKYNRQSMETYMTRSNRGSYMSSKTERSHVTEAGTQTEVNTAATTPSPGQSEAGYQPSIEEKPEEEEVAKSPEEVDYTQIDISAIRKLTAFPDLDEDLPAETNDDNALNIEIEQTTSPKTTSESEPELDADDEDDEFDQNESEISDGLSDGDGDDFEDAEEPIVYEVATVQPPRMLASQVVQMKGAVVNIPRRVPPPLPLRSPARMSRDSKSKFGDVSMISSPLRNEFEAAVQADEVSTPKARESFETSARNSIHDTPTPANEETTVGPKASEPVVDYLAQSSAVTEAEKPSTPKIFHAAKAEEEKPVEVKLTSTVGGETVA
ncbi:hypothetical protein LQW54_004380 [Pestalotiopsis sp. IQ-011]